jgi:hypothetical protein
VSWVNLCYSVPIGPRLSDLNRSLPASVGLRAALRDLSIESGWAGTNFTSQIIFAGMAQKSKTPFHSPEPSKVCLPEPCTEFDPSQNLFDQLRLLLTFCQSRNFPLTRNQAVRSLRQAIQVFDHARHFAQLPQCCDEIFILIPFVRRHRQFKRPARPGRAFSTRCPKIANTAKITSHVLVALCTP